MNVSMHSPAIVDAHAYTGSIGICGSANFEEQGGRTGSLSMFFDSSEDCQEAADKLAELAEQMRKYETSLPTSELAHSELTKSRIDELEVAK